MATRGWLLDGSSRLKLAILISVVCHAAVLFGINFKSPILKDSKTGNPLEVVLVNSKSASKPGKADALAQANRSDRRAETPIPLALKNNQAVETDTASQEAKQLEQEAQQLTTEANSDELMYQAEPPLAQSERSRNAIDTAGLVQRSLELARLEAQTPVNYEAHQHSLKRKFIGVRTREFRFARYAEDWRLKVERIGNLNYPEAARREGLYGKLQLTVGIKSDGSLESIEINRSSGRKVLDEAAIRIVNLAGQNGFAPFPPDISRDTDILHITRTWVFTRSDELASE
ncbi:protein TonB [Nitrosospira sp. Nsp1]|nr:protein TonB [Nitrosospira sp. Nsp1]